MQWWLVTVIINIKKNETMSMFKSDENQNKTKVKEWERKQRLILSNQHCTREKTSKVKKNMHPAIHHCHFVLKANKNEVKQMNY